MKSFITALLLPFLCLASCWAEDISWNFNQVKVVSSPQCGCTDGERCVCGPKCDCVSQTQVSGEEWYTTSSGHLFHEKTGWYWNPANRTFYRPSAVQFQPMQKLFAPLRMGSFGGDCPTGT